MMPPVVDTISGRATDEGGPSSTRPWSSIWVGHYDRASRRRHQRGGHRRLRAEAKRRRLVENVVLASMTAAVLVLVTIFYKILTR
jgi:hypothetical protein